MSKYKKEVIELFEEEKFVIPQIDYTILSALRKKESFQKSNAYSPFHGSNVVDKTAYFDNSGKVDVRKGYDFVRPEDEKKISDQELIEKYGTKYYEFSIINKDNNKEAYKGTNYNKNKVAKEEERRKETHPFSFITDASDVVDDLDDGISSLINERVVPNIPKQENIVNENKIFKLNVNIDEDDTFEYNTFSKDLPKPSQTTIPSFLTENKTVEEPRQIDDISYSDNVLNKAIDKNQTVEEAIKHMQNNDYQFDESKRIIPIAKETYEDDEYESKSYSSDTKSNSLNYDDYNIPYEDIFSRSSQSVENIHPAWLEEKKETINMALQSFGIDGEVITYTKGPAFTRYEVLLAPGVNVKKVNQIYENLQKDLQAKSLFLQTPIPGKNTVGIDVPNNVAEVVKYGDLLDDEYINNPNNLLLALGKDIDGHIVYQNITDMPHALIAGATQSGKSVCINTILVSLLIKNSPKDLRLILVDPKKVELSFYNDLPHLATPVIDDAKIATGALKWAVDEMERRYELLAKNKVRNIKDYKKKALTNPEMENMPYFVIVVDEFNDLIMQCGQEANDYIVRLAQKARAAGIHVILATQRPTVDVVSGNIKANITCRIAFRVASDVDSRTILDEVGAESLLGRGDMFIKNNGAAERAQGAYVSDEEITEICDYIINKYDPNYLFTHNDILKSIKSNEQGVSLGRETVAENSQLLFEIAMDCIEQNTCSINFITNRHNMGFNRASRIIDIFEAKGIVSPKNGTKGREILIDSYKLKDMYSNGEI